MKPFFSFYGSKYKAVKLYQPPQHDIIIEPFAGSACYSIKHHINEETGKRRQVFLCEKDPNIYQVWDFLINLANDPAYELYIDEKLKVDAKDIVNLKEDNRIEQEAKNFIGFWLVRGSTAPRMVPTGWMKQDGIIEGYPSSFWGEKVRERIKKQLPYIKHWRVFLDDYKEMHDFSDATWFIDPPYSTPAGKHYTYGMKKEEYKELGEWCMSKKGQVIVCEQKGADWLPFETLGKLRSLTKYKDENNINYEKGSDEVVWYNNVSNIEKQVNDIR